MAGGMAGLHNFVELSIHVVGAQDAAEHSVAFLDPAVLDEVVRCVNDEEGTKGEEEGRGADESERQMPKHVVQFLANKVNGD